MHVTFAICMDLELTFSWDLYLKSTQLNCGNKVANYIVHNLVQND